ncbi:Modification methylase DpnIIA [bacterium HR15]|nr:Modification methylase DpnIIA [bacterium HR15]
MMQGLPRQIRFAKAPPIKCQGIKTKLVPFIFRSIYWDEAAGGRWIEPFLGSGVVALNLAPQRALLADTNQHIIRFYQAVQQGEVTPTVVREYLADEGRKLERGGEDYYYEVRERFNRTGSPLDFLFLNRACFNGLMRFNRSGEFNVPFCRKPNRFTPAYISKIVNQIRWVYHQIQGKEWEFRVASWEETLQEAEVLDFIYLDPPYIGRHTDYYNHWGIEDTLRLADAMRQLPCGYALSMWWENPYRRNGLIEALWSDLELRVCRHFYHLGATEDLRSWMHEALLIRPGFAAPVQESDPVSGLRRKHQLSLL